MRLVFSTFLLAMLLVVDSFAAKDVYGGYCVHFDYHGHEKERQIAYQWYVDEVSYYLAGMTKDQIGVDLYDMDGDGRNEILVYVNGKDYCPRAGCPFTILRIVENGSKGYESINVAMSTHAEITILNSTTRGWHDILFRANGRFVAIWKWNGREYF